MTTESGSDPRRYAPATMRNREPILAALRDLLPLTGLVLEVASGTGEHAIFFAAAMPQLVWQPSDPDAAARASIEAWAAAEALPNLKPPLTINATSADWPIHYADAIFCANMVHISPWAATLGLLRAAGRLLPPGGSLILYGPFVRRDVPTAESNRAFDRTLRSQDPAWGLRVLEEVLQHAALENLHLDRVLEMPANNLIVVLRKRRAAR